MKEYFLKRENAYIRYQDFYGKKTPIIFIHGLGCAGSFDYIELLANDKLKEHRLIFIDLLGAGYSDKPKNAEYTVDFHAFYLIDFMKDLGIKKYVLFGHSLGGAIAIKIADLDKSSVESLIVAEPNLDKSTKGALSYIIAEYSEKDFEKFGVFEVVDRSKSSGYRLWTSSFLNWLAVSSYRLSKDAVRGSKPSWREIFYKLYIPKTFVMGELSNINIDEKGFIENKINIEIVKNAGHSMTLENPNGLANAILKALGD